MNAAARAAAVPGLLCGGTLRYVALRASVRRALPASQCMDALLCAAMGLSGGARSPQFRALRGVV